jgi:hypothetical protein
VGGLGDLPGAEDADAKRARHARILAHGSGERIDAQAAELHDRPRAAREGAVRDLGARLDAGDPAVASGSAATTDPSTLAVIAGPSTASATRCHALAAGDVAPPASVATPWRRLSRSSAQRPASSRSSR